MCAHILYLYRIKNKIVCKMSCIFCGILLEFNMTCQMARFNGCTVSLVLYKTNSNYEGTE